ncbi:MerR family transcriptional regulator [Actinocrispum wychmicini]|uniref:DNA-binding transcriptional MerR regulator n=1 Tax=Actinocrispum wychmicini TaxID=1213861 RepID=A0A4R2IVW0_9PSEU|nr:MerR family transcriptional regulator [Actinocrispum wychmicini]TCO49853.1 DNA-binding transcriptional MerR regulator [Actinocrispum wychmicini]
MKSSLTIGELAGTFGLATHVLRHWESERLLTPANRVNGRRMYTEEHVTRVAVIMRAKSAGMSLDQVRDMLNAPDGEERRRVLIEQRAQLDERIAQAQASKALIDHALECPVGDFTHCAEFQRLVASVSKEIFS